MANLSCKQFSGKPPKAVRHDPYSGFRYLGGKDGMRVDQLDLNLLAVLDSLLTHGSASKPADQLNMAQPTVSSALTRLRYYFHDDLMVMVGRRMVPTPLATSLQGPVAEVPREARIIARSRATFDPATSDATFVVCASDYVALILLTEVAKRLSQLAPASTLSVQPVGTSAEQRFGAGQIDLLIAPKSALDPIETQEELTRDPLVPVVWNDNDKYGSRLTRQEYTEATHAIVEFGEFASPGIMDTMLLDAGLTRMVRKRLPSFLMLAEFVVGTPHIATLPRLLVQRRLGVLPLRALEPDFALPVLTEYMRWPRHLAADPGAQWFRALVREVAEEVFRSGPADQ